MINGFEISTDGEPPETCSHCGESIDVLSDERCDKELLCGCRCPMSKNHTEHGLPICMIDPNKHPLDCGKYPLRRPK